MSKVLADFLSNLEGVLPKGIKASERYKAIAVSVGFQKEWINEQEKWRHEQEEIEAILAWMWQVLIGIPPLSIDREINPAVAQKYAFEVYSAYCHAAKAYNAKPYSAIAYAPMAVAYAVSAEISKLSLGDCELEAIAVNKVWAEKIRPLDFLEKLIEAV